MTHRALSMFLAIILALCWTGAAFADQLTEIEYNTFAGAPTETASATPTATATESPTPTATSSAAPTETASPTESASPTETAAPTPVVVLSEGSRGDSVKALQQKLRILGLTADSADGIYGSLTTAAVTRLQSYLALLNATGALSYTKLSTGAADSAMLELLDSGKIPAYYASVKNGSSGNQVSRVQYRLASLEYLLPTVVDGVFGVATEAAIKDFQTTNGLSATGIADQATQVLLFSASAKACPDPNARYPYKLIIDVSEQRVYVYQYANGSYSKLKARFVCSTGKVDTPTPLGTYRSTEQLDVWHYFTDYNCWAMYAYRIVGSIYFHSVIFNSKGAASPTSSSVRNLGRRASHGCVRLSVENAKWIYNNCPAGTSVTVRE